MRAEGCISLLAGQEYQPRYRKFWKRWNETFHQPKWAEGWRLTAALAFGAAIVVLLTNVIFTTWYFVAVPVHDGVRSLSTGNCSKADPINTWIHLLINACSTCLLASSDFCTQASPDI